MDDEKPRPIFEQAITGFKRGDWGDHPDTFAYQDTGKCRLYLFNCAICNARLDSGEIT